MRRRFLLLATFLAACVSRAPATSPGPEPPREVYVVRHAEKELEAGEDPPLSAAGAERAAALPASVPAGLVAIYSTNTRRTRATVQPVADARGLQIFAYDAGDHAELLASIRAQPPGPVLVAGHSNTIPGLLAALGVDTPVTIADDQYGDLFVVESASPASTLRIERFGPQ